MKQKCHKYSSESISQFVDNELLKEQSQQLAQHIKQCSHCSNLIKQYQTISTGFNTFTDLKTAQIDTTKVRQKLDQTIQKSQEKSYVNIFGFLNKNLYLKLASVAALFFITIFTFQAKLLTPSGPSAIVTSVDTNFSSVMILETQNSHHTIIWYSET